MPPSAQSAAVRTTVRRRCGRQAVSPAEAYDGSAAFCAAVHNSSAAAEVAVHRAA
ncbi:hypothetical protein ABZ905_27175 [Streptomyces parvus]|uniref:hypothetical protein n=1 Tax=Streptomyces parvus TaxID=66428 RepID=UPI0033C0267A